MSLIRRVAKDWLPPALVRAVRGVVSSHVTWRGNYSSWDRAAAESRGYDADEILTRVRRATAAVMRGEAAFERDGQLFEESIYHWPLLACLMWAGARGASPLSVMDFGGSLGSTWFQHKPLLSRLPDIRWSVVEQPHYVAVGQAEVQGDGLYFYESIDACGEAQSPNVILLSSVLQYLPSPEETLVALAATGAKTLIIDRTPFIDGEDDQLVVQHVPKALYLASYPCRLFSRSALEARLKTDWTLEAYIESPEGQVKTTDGIEFSFGGLLLSRNG